MYNVKVLNGPYSLVIISNPHSSLHLAEYVLPADQGSMYLPSGALGTGDQGSEKEGNRGTKAILGNREHKV